MPLGGVVGDADTPAIIELKQKIGPEQIGTLGYGGFFNHNFGVTPNSASTITLDRGTAQSGLPDKFTPLRLGDKLIIAQGGHTLTLIIDKIS